MWLVYCCESILFPQLLFFKLQMTLIRLVHRIYPNQRVGQDLIGIDGNAIVSTFGFSNILPLEYGCMSVAMPCILSYPFLVALVVMIHSRGRILLTPTNTQS